MCVLKSHHIIVPVTVNIRLIQGSATQDVGKNVKSFVRKRSDVQMIRVN